MNIRPGVTVTATPEKCWAVFHDTTLMKQWLDGFESVTLKTKEPIQEGSKCELIVNDDETPHGDGREKIIAINAPSPKSRTKSTMMCCDRSSQFSFEGATSTIITSRYKVTGNTLAWKSILLISRSYMTQAAQHQLDELKKVIEKK